MDLHLTTFTHEGRFWEVYLEFVEDSRDPESARARLCFVPTDQDENEEPEEDGGDHHRTHPGRRSAGSQGPGPLSPGGHAALGDLKPSAPPFHTVPPQCHRARE